MLGTIRQHRIKEKGQRYKRNRGLGWWKTLTLMESRHLGCLCRCAACEWMFGWVWSCFMTFGLRFSVIYLLWTRANSVRNTFVARLSRLGKIPYHIRKVWGASSLLWIAAAHYANAHFHTLGHTTLFSSLSSCCFNPPRQNITLLLLYLFIVVYCFICILIYLMSENSSIVSHMISCLYGSYSTHCFSRSFFSSSTHGVPKLRLCKFAQVTQRKSFLLWDHHQLQQRGWWVSATITSMPARRMSSTSPPSSPSPPTTPSPPSSCCHLSTLFMDIWNGVITTRIPQPSSSR